MRCLSLADIVALHRRLLEATEAAGICDLALELGIARPRRTFAEADRYPTLIENGAELCFALVQNHSFLGATNASATVRPTPT
jgi:prophage maintenance system killer protein